jgi:hypothetical protein
MTILIKPFLFLIAFGPMATQPCPLSGKPDNPERSSGAFTRLTDCALETWYHLSIA